MTINEIKNQIAAEKEQLHKPDIIHKKNLQKIPYSYTNYISKIKCIKRHLFIYLRQYSWLKKIYRIYKTLGKV